jgi:shikimate dehydrogenase
MTQRYGIIGHPVAHSLSPAMHNAAFKALNIDATFESFDVAPEELEQFIRDNQDIQGAAVTIPHKQTIGQFLEGLDELSQNIGAVNTIYTQDGHHYGTNTDAAGFLRALKEKIPDLKGKRAMVIGAGGAARAVVATLVPQVDSVTIINRTIPHGVDLAKTFGCRYGGKIEDLTTETPDIIVNATSVGMEEGDETEIIPASFLHPETLIFDIVYRKSGPTHLIKEAEAAGCPTVDGKTMLLYQGEVQFEIWTGQKPPEDVMKQALEQA